MRAECCCSGFHAVAVPAIGLLLTVAGEAAETLTGKVVKVADGDTLTLLVGTDQVRVRLHGIDAPEKNQAFGSRARQALSDRVRPRGPADAPRRWPPCTACHEDRGFTRRGGEPLARMLCHSGQVYPDRLQPLDGLRNRPFRLGVAWHGVPSP